MKHLFIINPIAGGKNCRFEETHREVQEFVKTLKDPAEIYVTKAPFDACTRIEEVAETVDKLFVYACGGDGTLNECANAAANRPNVAITHYPCGTGNDFLKTFGSENAAKFRDLEALATGEIRPIDLIECNDRYGINICSVGIDARIGTDVHKYSKLPIIGGATGYVVSLVINVLKGVVQKFKITADGEVLDKNITLACACNGRYYGGGFNPVPDALPDDGILDCLIVEPVSRFQVAKIVGKYAKGKFKELPDIIRHLRTTELQIEADRKFVVNIDGEAAYTNKMRFKLIKNGVNFIFPAKMSCFRAKA
ncbi:MAG: diacylglycerol kinase family lipid kinase [Oscillospiraceae bacterium]|nr:diacylglycerol kinase family lipid kinase [Oscillospiraceae bacterium]MCL2279164.1 diacylglycerol kinase family lipid kinase [Oscillospiraceae bacterium]